MNRVLLSFALASILASPAFSQTDKNPLPSRERQTELALSAAPESVRSKAAVWIMGAKAYEKVREGSNGFTCIYGQEVAGAIEPECYDAEGGRTVLQARFRAYELECKGMTREAAQKQVDEDFSSGKLPVPHKTGIVYMMSTENRVVDPESKQIVAFPPHVMFYAPYIKPEDLGGDGEGVPYIVDPGKADALIIVVPASKSKQSTNNGGEPGGSTLRRGFRLEGPNVL